MKKIVACGAVLLLMGICIPAMGQEEDVMKPCVTDVSKFCKDVKPGQGRVKDCLKSHQADLSQECKGQIVKAKEKAKDVQQACQQDIQTRCPDVQPGEGRLYKCLKANKDKLSDSCKSSLKSLKKQKQ